ncbi:hypothetical protein PVAP13_8NG188600 [Panicum virgatum]|uniref:Uncharacterized protein n=1 Tax=Panicum virgatum TaxID=38727 RepID=A0A8T0P4H5_PANVG|nr:hypothetical protein PVAP13_8NG188600 [Panicum virgatum]
MGMVCLQVAAAMLVLIMYSTLLSTTKADEVRCGTLQKKCDSTNCNKLQCRHSYGNHHFERVYCKVIVPFDHQCCCEFKMHSRPPQAGHHPSPASRQLNPVPPSFI